VLTLVEDGSVRRIYPTAVGKPGTPTPVGQFTIANRIVNPTWYGRKDPVPPGPRNPLGSRWLGLSRPHYGIHGTNAPASIGKAASGGCIRMHKEHVEELYTLVSVGDVVELSNRSFDEILRAYSSPAIPAPVETVAD
jgi:lipoprotein-anchoring transpeptidase ErfK/SrfK